MPRRPTTGTPERATDGPRINGAIRARVIQLITESGDNLGPTDRDEAIRRATEAGLDLVEIAPNSDPPVCKILDFGKYKYQAQKKAAEARKKQKVVEIKEIKMRPNIDDHDYGVKVKAIHRFFEEGDKVKITLRFRGREMAHTELGMDLMRRVKADFENVAKIESEPRYEGRQIVMVMAPR
ncbi:MAG: translation initiation factor IF-3 [Hyphomicrobiaceae bacterium]